MQNYKTRAKVSSRGGQILSLLTLSLMVVGVSPFFFSCARPAEKKTDQAGEGRHIYKDLKAEVYPVPEGVKKALPGLLNDNIYVYREIAPTLNLVAYVPNYSREAAVKMVAEAFAALVPNPEFRRGIEFWIVQVQPAPTQTAAGEKSQSQVVVWGVRPSEVDTYLSSQDLASFLANSEYLLVDDKIIPKGEDRLKEFPGLAAPPSPQPQSGATTGAMPAPGSAPPPPGTVAPKAGTPHILLPQPPAGGTTVPPSPSPGEPAPGQTPSPPPSPLPPASGATP